MCFNGKTSINAPLHPSELLGPHPNQARHHNMILESRCCHNSLNGKLFFLKMLDVHWNMFPFMTNSATRQLVSPTRPPQCLPSGNIGFSVVLVRWTAPGMSGDVRGWPAPMPWPMTILAIEKLNSLSKSISGTWISKWQWKKLFGYILTVTTTHAEAAKSPRYVTV